MDPPINKEVSTQTTQHGQTNYSQTAAVNLLNQVFAQLKGIFPAWHTSCRTQQEEAEAKRQWLQGLIEAGITSDLQINAGLAKCRAQSSPFMPSVGQFVDWCKYSSREHYAPLEACYAELTGFVTSGRKDTQNLTDILYHTVTRNLDFYNYKKIEKEWERIKAFEIAYKATLFQIEKGEPLAKPPEPETLIEDKSQTKRVADSGVADKTISSILSMFDEPKPKPPNPEDIKDLERVERLKNGNA